MNRTGPTSFDRESASMPAKWFITSAGMILLITGAAKLYSAGGSARILGMEDPIFHFPFRVMMLIAASMEVVVGIVCLLNRSTTWPLSSVVWLAMLFATYRVGLWVGDYRSPCSCLGALTDALHLSSAAAERISLALLAYLLAGSTFFLISDKWLKWRAAPGEVAAGQL